MRSSGSKHELIIAPAGAANFGFGRDIILSVDEQVESVKRAPGEVVFNHLESLDHCPTTHEELRERMHAERFGRRVFIPADGELLEFHRRSTAPHAVPSEPTIRFTGPQKAAWEAAVQEELAGKEENIAHYQKIKAAAEQPGFFGDLRRAIALSRMSMDELSGKIGVDQRLLSDFRAGDAELPGVALDRLIQALGLRLMHEIPR